MTDNVAKADKLICKTLNKLKYLIKDANIVIGGTVALVLQGIEIGREIDDIDVIIYKPTKEQKDVLEVLEAFSTTKYYGKDKRTIKLEFGTHTINIIKEDKLVPNNLLYVNYNETFIKVQSVCNVVEAKNSYTKNNGNCARKKDIKDLITFKNLNFNIE